MDGEYFIPVRFGLKHRTNGEATLYVIMDQQPVESKKIKAEVVKIPETQQNVAPAISRSALKISIEKLAVFVNGKDLLRYLPDDMLRSEQNRNGMASQKQSKSLRTNMIRNTQNVLHKKRTTGSLRSLPNRWEDPNPSTKAQRTAGGLFDDIITHHIPKVNAYGQNQPL